MYIIIQIFYRIVIIFLFEVSTFPAILSSEEHYLAADHWPENNEHSLRE